MNSLMLILSTSRKVIGGKAGDNTTDCLGGGGVMCRIGDANKLESNGMRVALLVPAFEAVVLPIYTGRIQDSDKGDGICPNVGTHTCKRGKESRVGSRAR